MSTHHKKPARRPVRRIKSKRDFEAASAVAKHLNGQAARDAAAEERLQALLHELDKFDAPEDDPDLDLQGGFDYSGPTRRWSDDGSDRE